MADIDGGRATAVAEGTGDRRFDAATVDASDARAIAELARSVRADVVMNAADPRFVMPIFNACLEAVSKLLAPILAFTADEAWEFIPGKPQMVVKIAGGSVEVMKYLIGRDLVAKHRPAKG